MTDVMLSDRQMNSMDPRTCRMMYGIFFIAGEGYFCKIFSRFVIKNKKFGIYRTHTRKVEARLIKFQLMNEIIGHNQYSTEQTDNIT